MPILCLDTATTTARVAVVDETSGAVLAAREATAARHSSNVLRLCDEVLVQAGLVPAALQAIACGAGPGSFTGLRVGLAVAKGLAMPTGVPLLLVSSLAAMALDIFAQGGEGAVAPESLALPCLDAGKADVHGQLFRRDADALVVPLHPPVVARPAELPSRFAPQALPVVVAGGGADRYGDLLDGVLPAGWKRHQLAGPTATSVGRLAILRLRQGSWDDLERSVPTYGRAPDITVKKPRTK